jgi:carbamoyltransferase
MVDKGALVVGISGARQNAAVSVVADGRLQAFCEQERIVRRRSAALEPGALPTEALQAALRSVGRAEEEIGAFVTAESAVSLPACVPHVRLDHHFAHAATAALTSPFESAAVLVCDGHSDPPVSVWRFEDGELVNQRWEWKGPGFAAIYSECAELFGFGPRAEHRLEALARLDPGARFGDLAARISYHRDLLAERSWVCVVSEWLSACGSPRNLRDAAIAASSFQRCLGDALVALVADIRETLPHEQLCLGGGLFFNTYFNTRLVKSGLFRDLFVPANPGNTGLAVGAALAVAAPAKRERARSTTPFLGPSFQAEEIKATLDNCKLTYEYGSESHAIQTAVAALARGALVGWFQGAMEWGPRSLGHRSILANPRSPYVLENLNRYLKQREPHRAYALSVCRETAPKYFLVPAASPLMEYEYELLEPETFRHVLPEGANTLRVQTIDEEPALFRALHQAFEAETGIGVLVNTSFNGFHEPIVCSPRDAVRVFYGTGLDLLVLGRFIVRK